MLDQEAADWKTEIVRLRQLPEEFKEKELHHLSRSRLVESLQSGIQKMRYELQRAYERAGSAEKGWKDLESTFVVRQARKIRMIRVEPCWATDNGQTKTAGNRPSRLIAVDMTPMLPGGENGGAKIFTMELLRSFQQHAHKDHFLLLTAAWNHEELAALDGPNMSRLCVMTGKTKGRPSSMDRYPGLLRRSLGRVSRAIRQVSRTGISPRRVLGSQGVDLLFCPFTAPTYAESGIPTVCVLYDLQHREFPQFFSPHEIGVRDGFMKEISERADHIVCISEHVRQTVLKYLQTDPKRTHTAHVCIQSRLSIPDERTLDRERSRLGIDRGPYMFYPANFWPHKNHRMLLTAYGMFLSRNSDSPLDLVFTGALPDLETEMKQAVDRMGLTDRVHFLGFLPQEQLEVVWYGCDFLVFPSLYEGFGIPVLEAMSMGKPVLCSKATSLPEVAGEAALYFDPRKPGDMVACMERLVQDPQHKRDLAERGMVHAAGFSPEDMRNTYTEIFDLALGITPDVVGAVSGVYDDGWIGEEMRIHFGPGSGNRSLEVRLSAPLWLPSARIRLKLIEDGRIVKKARLLRGKDLSIARPLPEQAGCFSLILSPTFRPSECDIGTDDRVLGVKCNGCWIVYADQNRISLLKAEEECAPL